MKDAIECLKLATIEEKDLQNDAKYEVVRL